MTSTRYPSKQNALAAPGDGDIPPDGIAVIECGDPIFIIGLNKEAPSHEMAEVGALFLLFQQHSDCGSDLESFAASTETRAVCMPHKPKAPRIDLAKDLWVNPRSNIRGPEGSRAWDNEGNISPEKGSRFLELADVALGLKRPTVRKKKAASAAAHPRIEKNGS